MNSIFNQTIRWVVRHFLSLVLILAVLIAGNFIQKEYRDYKSSEDEVSVLANARQEINEYRLSNERKVSERVAKNKAASQQLLNSEIEFIDQEIQQKKLDQQKTGNLLTLLQKFPSVNGIVEYKKLEIEILLLRQARDYLKQLSISIKGKDKLDILRKAYDNSNNKLINNESMRARLVKEHPVAVKNPAYYEYWTLRDLENSHRTLLDNKKIAGENYQKNKNSKMQIGPFKINPKEIDEMLEPLYTKIDDHLHRISNNWFEMASKAILEVFWVAIWILLSIILIPITIKIFFYYILAPLASGRPAICILSNASGTIEDVTESIVGQLVQTKISAVSLQLHINEHQELLIHPEYLQSSSVHGKKDTKWLLSNLFPFSSVVSGMVALTRIRTDTSESVVISATKDPFSEVGLLSLPKGSAIALQPRSLVGVIQRKDLPMQITSHWQFFSLHAWLTLQLRYLVFHGPAKLIVKGCRGVRVEKAGIGRRISQAATIGFSANLQYSTARCETFFPYLTAKQELLNDGFAGESGFYIYEEMPHYGKNSGLASRGLEGFTDSLLKIFGI